jgi:tetratricopeptide (TPR) repeat protein
MTVDAIPDVLSRSPMVADETTADAFALLRAGRFDAAIASLARAVSSTPTASADSPAAHAARGHAAELEGRITDARREYEAALPGTLAGRAALYVGLARLAQVDGDPPAAIAAFTHATRIDPNDPNVHKELALALPPQQPGDDALGEAVAALLIDPRDAQAHAIVGQVDLDAGRTADAVIALTRALDLSPGRYETHYTLATAFTRLGRTADAAHERELFERGRLEALERRRQQIAHEVERAESVRRGASDPAKAPSSPAEAK